LRLVSGCGRERGDDILHVGQVYRFRRNVVGRPHDNLSIKLGVVDGPLLLLGGSARSDVVVPLSSNPVVLLVQENVVKDRVDVLACVCLLKPKSIYSGV